MMSPQGGPQPTATDDLVVKLAAEVHHVSEQLAALISRVEPFLANHSGLVEKLSRLGVDTDRAFDRARDAERLIHEEALKRAAAIERVEERVTAKLVEVDRDISQRVSRIETGEARRSGGLVVAVTVVVLVIEVVAPLLVSGIAP